MKTKLFFLFFFTFATFQTGFAATTPCDKSPAVIRALEKIYGVTCDKLTTDSYRHIRTLTIEGSSNDSLKTGDLTDFHALEYVTIFGVANIPAGPLIH